MNSNMTLTAAVVLTMAAGASTEARAETLHTMFKACDYCTCGTSETLPARLPAGRVVIKLRTSGWDPTSFTGYPTWAYYNALKRNRSSWTGWGEILPNLSEDRIKWVKGTRTPERPKPGDQVSFEDEFAVSEPTDIQARMSSQCWHDGSGAAHQTASENWLTIEAVGAVIPAETGGPTSATGPAASTKLFENWNTGACGYTDSSSFELRTQAHVDQIDLWYHWRGRESSVPYTISHDGQTIRTGTLHRAECDVNQEAWCVARDSVDIDAGPGAYIVRTERPRVCQNSASAGAGFVKAFGQRTRRSR